MIDSTCYPVSVVIPCYLCGETIRRALASVYAQTWQPAEAILVDDCSGDDTLSLLHKLKDEYPRDWIRVLTLSENGGPGRARNVGWENASQPYIAFLDADDAWHPEKIKIQLNWMLQHPVVALTGHDCPVVNDHDEHVQELVASGKHAFKRVSGLRQLLSNRFPTRSVILKRDLPHRFAPEKRHCEDYLLWCDICLDDYPCYHSSLSLGFLFKAAYGEAGLSENLWKMEKGELDCYSRLHHSGRIGLLSRNILTVLSLAKYFLRISRVSLRSVRS